MERVQSVRDQALRPHHISPAKVEERIKALEARVAALEQETVKAPRLVSPQAKPWEWLERDNAELGEEQLD